MYTLPLMQIGIMDIEEQEKVIDFLINLAKIGIKNKALNDSIDD